jgi:hypothetical protein
MSNAKVATMGVRLRRGLGSRRRTRGGDPTPGGAEDEFPLHTSTIADRAQAGALGVVLLVDNASCHGQLHLSVGTVQGHRAQLP